jgi:hypothetical protein
MTLSWASYNTDYATQSKVSLTFSKVVNGDERQLQLEMNIFEDFTTSVTDQDVLDAVTMIYDAAISDGWSYIDTRQFYPNHRRGIVIT